MEGIHRKSDGAHAPVFKYNIVEINHENIMNDMLKYEYKPISSVKYQTNDYDVAVVHFIKIINDLVENDKKLKIELVCKNTFEIRDISPGRVWGEYKNLILTYAITENTN